MRRGRPRIGLNLRSPRALDPDGRIERNKATYRRLLEGLLGARPADRAAGDAALEEHVLAAGPERDAALLPVLHRRLQRHEWLVEPVLRELRGARMQRLE